MGNPDYQGYAQWRGNTIAGGTIGYTSVTPYMTQFWITNWNALSIHFTNNTKGCKVSVAFYTDSTLAFLVDSYDMVVTPNGFLGVTLPCLGSYCTVTVSTTQTGSPTATLIITPSNIPVPAARFQDNRYFYNGQAVTINAGATLSVNPPYTAQGVGSIFFGAAGAVTTFNVFVNSLGQDGLLNGRFYQANTVNNIQPALFNVGAVPTQLQITNTDSANHSCAYGYQVISS